MSWKLDNIDFEDFGVYVNKSSGVLDLPRMIDESINWLDENGREYWQSIDNIKYADREIVLSCFIYNLNGYEDFKTKVTNFYNALSGPGKRILETPFGNTIEVSLQQPVQLTRKTSYVSSQQFGIFTLRLTVHGNTDFDLVSVYDKSSSVVKEVIKTKNLTVHKTLQGEEYAECTVESDKPLQSGMYDYIKVNIDGIGFDYFLLPSTPAARKDSANRFVYDLRFEGITLHFKQMKFSINDVFETEFYGNLQDVAELVCENVNRFIWFADRFTVGSCEATVKKLHNFSNEDCLSILQRICTEYGMEYRFQRQPDTSYQIHISEFANKPNPVRLEYGKENSLYQISRGAMDTTKLCTVLWAFGAAKNLKADYRGGKKRLSFDGNPLRINENLYGTWEHIENFDEIYPKRTAVVTGYLQVLKDNLTNAEKEVFPEGIFIVGDSTLDFDINNFLSGGLTAKIAMKTGDLAGYQFDIKRYDHENKHIHIIRYKDEVGNLFPNDLLMIAPGDEYTLIDINQPESYVAAAENELMQAAQAYINKWSIPAHPYNVKTKPGFTNTNPGTGFDIGDVMSIFDSDLSIDVENRVTNLTYYHRNKTYDLTLSVFKRLPKRLETEFRLQTIERSMLLTRKDTGEVIRDDKQPTDEAKRKLLDPDDKLRIDEIVRNSAIDPRHISWDLNVPQMFIDGALVETDVDGDYNQVRIGVGKINVANDPDKALSRYEIKKLRDNDITYDPTRSWNINQEEFTLASDDSHFMYAKINIAPGSTACTILLTPERIEPKLEIEDGFVYYELGTIPKAEEIV